MKTAEFVDRLCNFAREYISTKSANPVTLMMVGAATSGVGRKILERRIVPFIEMAANESGDVDLSGVKESLTTGFGLAGSVPVLGGAISIDQSDAEAFFASLR